MEINYYQLDDYLVFGMVFFQIKTIIRGWFTILVRKNDFKMQNVRK